MAQDKKKSSPKKRPTQNNNAQLFRNFVILVVGLIIVGFAYRFVQEPTQSEDISLRQLVEHIESGEVKTIEIAGDQTIDIILVNDETVSTRKESGQPLTELLAQNGVSEETIRSLDVTVTSNTGFGYWFSVLWPGLFTLIIIAVIIWFMLRQVQGANSKAMMFGKSGAKESNPNDKKNKVTFKDVAGSEESKEELSEVVDFLKHPQKYAELGAKVPRGVLQLLVKPTYRFIISLVLSL